MRGNWRLTLRGTRPRWSSLSLFYLGFLAAAAFGQRLAIAPDSPITLFPPNGVFIAALLLGRRESAPWWVPVAWCAEMSANALWYHNPLLPACGYFAANAIESLLGAMFLRRYFPRPVRLETLQQVGALFATGLAAPIVGATIGSGIDHALGKHAFAAAWPLWWLGDAVGVLLALPLSLVLAEILRKGERPSGKPAYEPWLLAAAIPLVSAGAVSGNLLSPYMALPLLLWAAARYEFAGAVLSLSAVTMVTGVLTAEGHGVFTPGFFDEMGSRMGDPYMRMLAYIGNIAFSSLIVAALSRQRELAVRSLTALNASLEQTVVERTEAIQARSRQLALVARVSDILLRSTEPEQVMLEGILAEIAGEIGMETIFLYRPSPEDPNLLRLSMSIGMTEEQKVLYGSLRVGDLLSGRVAERRERIVVENLQHTSEPGSEALRGSGGRSFAAFPLVADDELIGTISFGSARATLFAEGELEAIQTICDQIALTIERRRLHRELEAQEAELRDRDDHMRLLLHAARAITYEWDIQADRVRRIHSSEPAMPRTDGWEDKFDGVLARVHPADRELFSANVRQALLSGEHAYRSEHRVVAPDGTETWLLEAGRVDLDSEGRATRLIGISFDITKRKVVEEALRRSEELLRTVLSSTPDLVWAMDREGRITLANNAAIEWMGGGDAGQVLGRNMRDHLSDEAELHAIDANDDVVLREGRTILVEERATGNGRQRVFQSYKSPLRDAGGEIIGIVGISRDITDQKRGEEALRHSEELLRTVLSSTPDLVWVKDRDGRITLGNQATFDRLGGGDPAHVLGGNAQDLVPDEADAKVIDDNDALVLREGQTVLVEEQFPENGEKCLFQSYKSPLRNAEGEIIGIVGVSRDVTEQKRAEEALRRQRDLIARQLTELDSLYAEAPLGLGLLDCELKFVRINSALAEMNGFTAAEHIGRTVWNLVPDLRSAAEPALLQVLKTGAPLRDILITGETAAQPGVPREWREHFYPVLEGKRIVGVGIVCEDITERSRAERLLRENEERLRALVAATSTITWTCAPDGRQVEPQPEWMAFTGQTAEQMLGDGWMTAVHPDDAAAVGDEWARWEAEEVPFSCALRIRRRDGEWRWMDVKIAPMPDDAGGIRGWAGLSIDVTERKRAEDRQRMLMRELAHRGKNLLGVIQSVANRTLRGERTLAEARDAFAGRLQALSNTYSSLTDESFEGAPLHEIVHAEMAAHGGRVRIEGPAVMLSTKVAQTMALAVHELATNAAKYGALSVPGGAIRISWALPGAGADRRLVFEWRESGGPARKPARTGFGTTLLTTVVAGELRCTPEVHYGEEGFRYRFDTLLSAAGAPIGEMAVRTKLRSELLQGFHDAWSTAKGEKAALPKLEDFEASAYRASGGLTLAEITAGGQVRFLTVGHALTERLERPLSESDLSTKEDRHSLLEAFRRCARDIEPCHEHLRFDFGEGESVTFERLLVPFSADGVRVTHLAGLAVFSGAA